MEKRKLRILAIEPYFGGSHASILEGLARHSAHEFHILSMPARKWKWRMRGAAIEFADRARREGGRFDLVFAGDMMSVADFRALAPTSLGGVPIVAYFHENQLTYPLPDEADRDYQYGFTNITTCLASDEVWFNSAYHRDEFLEGAEALLAKMPDFVPKDLVARIDARSRVVHPGVEAAAVPGGRRRRPYTVLWNHRWEWDKNPNEFFAALGEVRAAGCDFRLAVAGQSFRERPAIFEGARAEFADITVNWGYLESRREYRELLRRCDIVVSTARHEFFGLGVVEAVSAGCVPLLPRRLSYPELFDPDTGGALFYGEGKLAGRLRTVLGGKLPTRGEAARLAAGYLWERRIAEWDELFRGAARAGGRR